MMKKMLIWVLAIVLCLSLVPSLAAEEIEVENIEFTTDSDEPLKFNGNAFAKVLPAGISGDLSYVKFDEVETGSLWYDLGGKKEVKVKTEKYYIDGTKNLMEDVYYVPKATKGDAEVEITYTAYTTKSKSYTGTVIISVNEAENDGDFDRIFYYVKAGKYVTLEADKIYKVCRNKDFVPEYASFSIDSGSARIFYNYKPSSSSNKGVNSSSRYYIDPDDGDEIDKLSVVVNEEAEKDINICYTVWDEEENSKQGYIKIRLVTEEENQELSYEVTGENVFFVADDFNEVCKVKTGSKLSYITFPKSPSDGTLYYDYDNEEGERAKISASKTKKYYFSNKDPYLYLVSYVPETGFKDEVIIEYTGYSVDEEDFEGKIIIDVDTPDAEEAPDIEYSIKNTDTKDFTSGAFSSACDVATDGETLDYVKFESLPSSKQGKLYYDDEDVVVSEKYTKSDIKKMVFEPKEGYKGTVTLKYLGYSEDGTRFEGKVVIEVTGTTTSTTTKKDEDDKTPDTITLKGEKGKAIKFDADEFYDVADDYNGEDLICVKFTAPPASSGVLYYDYGGSDEFKIDDSDEFYYDEDEDLILSEVSFVPAKAGSISIKYIAYTDDDEFKATVTVKAESKEGIENFKHKKTYKNGAFKDVDEDAWYGANSTQCIKLAYRYGLMQGTADDLFDPAGNITVAQALTIAARIHDIYYNNKTEFEAGDTWYEEYVAYAIENDIVKKNDFANYENIITREEMAYIFANIIPSKELDEINDIEVLPDVDEDNEYFDDIIFLYQVGVITGNDAKGTFMPKSYISRAEVSAIVVRLIESDSRIEKEFE